MLAGGGEIQRACQAVGIGLGKVNDIGVVTVSKIQLRDQLFTGRVARQLFLGVHRQYDRAIVRDGTTVGTYLLCTA